MVYGIVITGDRKVFPSAIVIVVVVTVTGRPDYYVGGYVGDFVLDSVR